MPYKNDQRGALASSKRRNPRVCSSRIANAITPVMRPAGSSGKWKEEVQSDRCAEELRDVG